MARVGAARLTGKVLVVTADDLGADEARDRGIREAVEAGVVTATSLLANGPTFEAAAAWARGQAGRVSVGLHLNLSEGRPLAAGLRRLVGPDGLLLGKRAARALLEAGGPDVQAEVRAELEAQLARLRAAGVAPTHLDGHQHLHALPAAREVVADAARAHGVGWVRCPEEPDDARAPADERPLIAAHALHARALRAALAARGLRTTGHFRGWALKGRLDARTLVATVAELPAGSTELMVHPARLGAEPPRGPFAGFLGPAREAELDALLDRRFREALALARCALTTWAGA